MHLKSGKKNILTIWLCVCFLFAYLLAGYVFCPLLMFFCSSARFCLEFRIDYFVSVHNLSLHFALWNECGLPAMFIRTITLVSLPLLLCRLMRFSARIIPFNYQIERMNEWWCKAIALCIRMTNSLAIWFNGSQLKRNTINHFLHMRTVYREGNDDAAIYR